MNGTPKSRQAVDWLKQPGTDNSVIRQAQALARLQADVDQWTASNRLKLQVGPVRDNALKLYTDHAATLARARQQLPTLQAHLRARGWQIDRIDLKLKTFIAEAPSPTQAPKRGRFPASAQSDWVKLRNSVQDEGMRQAIERLCKHNGWDN